MNEQFFLKPPPNTFEAAGVSTPAEQPDAPVRKGQISPSYLFADSRAKAAAAQANEDWTMPKRGVYSPYRPSVGPNGELIPAIVPHEDTPAPTRRLLGRRPRRTHCDLGHEMTDTNTVVLMVANGPGKKKARRICRTCRDAKLAAKEAAIEAAKRACKRGHSRVAENLTADGSCRVCKNMGQKKSWAEKKQSSVIS